jgi:hypothetical protein
MYKKQKSSWIFKTLLSSKKHKSVYNKTLFSYLITLNINMDIHSVRWKMVDQQMGATSFSFIAIATNNM